MLRTAALLCLLLSATAHAGFWRKLCNLAWLYRPVQATTLEAFYKQWPTLSERRNRLDGRTVALADGQFKLGKYLGSGLLGVVYCLGDCRRVIKFAKGPSQVAVLREEIEGDRSLRAAGIATATIHNAEAKDPYYLIKTYVKGRSLLDIMHRGLSEDQLAALADLFVKGRAHNLLLDLNATNWIWDSTGKRIVCIDQMLHEIEESSDLDYVYCFKNWWQRFPMPDQRFRKFRELVIAGLRDRGLPPPPEDFPKDKADDGE